MLFFVDVSKEKNSTICYFLLSVVIQVHQKQGKEAYWLPWRRPMNMESEVIRWYLMERKKRRRRASAESNLITFAVPPQSKRQALNTEHQTQVY